MNDKKNPQEQELTLKALRESVGLTQEELSRRLNVGVRMIGAWERGKSIPRFDRAVALADVLEVPLEVLAQAFQLKE